MLCLALIVGFSAECLAKKPESIVIGLLADMTGPYAAITGHAPAGLEDAVKYINEGLGGIDGVKLRTVIRDNLGKVALGLQQYTEIIEIRPKPLFIDVPITPLADAFELGRKL